MSGEVFASVRLALPYELENGSYIATSFNCKAVAALREELEKRGINPCQYDLWAEGSRREGANLISSFSLREKDVPGSDD